ncbi:MAG: cyclophilin-like fold protein [Thermodesulfobacteriota bacterium]|nr:cyclophilin-like fold protein [Thermodesulfobacteriota bacterium]
MVTQVKIEIGNLRFLAVLKHCDTAQQFLNLLPITITMNRWGEEYYGDCGMHVDESCDAKVLMEVGEIAIWPPGKAFCIFFGPTPVSTNNEPVAASPVNPIGKIIDDTSPMKELGQRIEARMDIVR